MEDITFASPLREVSLNAQAPKKHAKSRGKKTVEETYTKISQLDHVLLRPDTYIGSAACIQWFMWVWDEKVERMVYKNITYPPGLYKIFDEILVNAADHKQRDPSMKNLKVDIDEKEGVISVYNDGAGIPVELHKKEGMYVPELIFGHLLTSSNYDDDEKKVVGGRNGYGAKLANIFSTRFEVATADAERELKYKQVFTNNMQTFEKPRITKNKKKESWTRITFSPDLEKFGLLTLDKDVISLLKKRVYDIAGSNPSLKVFLNGKRLPIRSFKDYVKLHFPQDNDTTLIHDRSGRWEVVVACSDGQMNQVSFVNSICTVRGGAHVNHVADQIVARIIEMLKKKHKGLKIKPFQIKQHLRLFINCLIENPAFDSQTKETLTTTQSKFGSKWLLKDDMAKKILKSEIFDRVMSSARLKLDKELAKTDGGKKTRLTGIKKLDDANKAGGRESSKCTLILTEGDSAKTLAVSGLSVVGRDYYGVFPLRGKLLNVREASHKQIMDNKEITNLKKIVGLQQNKAYDESSIKSLRYGHILIMADQDHDGSHIKGLIINLFHHFWPSLLKVSGFLQEFITPIVKGTKGQTVKTFFTIPEYKTWLEEIGNVSSWEIKYYKGLGTSTSGEAREYFSNLDRHKLEFSWGGLEDGKMIDLAFSKQKVNDRKTWLAEFEPGTYFDHITDELNFTNFVNKELVLFSVADNQRSIPCVVDGLKPSQRKVMYTCFKRKQNKEMKVTSLAGEVMSKAAYHHGDASLQSTIVGLALNFVGSNNLNLLVPAGQFGTRLHGGKDASSSRYISTCLAPVARAIFPALDDALLSYLDDDGKPVEPQWYAPVVPLVLLNGADGIGTGWSTSVPCYDPADIIRNVRRMLKGDGPIEMIPWYRNFKGTISPMENSRSYDVHGVVRKLDDSTLRITELPVKIWTSPYKEFLETCLDAGGPVYIKEMRDQSTESNVDFTVSMAPNELSALEQSGLFKKLKLSSTVCASNMVLFDHTGKLRRYDTTCEIFSEFFQVRMDLYVKRKSHILGELSQKLEEAENRKRFILMVIDGTVKVAKRSKIQIVKDLARHGFKQIVKNGKPKYQQVADEENSDNDSQMAQNESPSVKGYNYLLSMPLWSLTLERVEELCQQRDAIAAEIEQLAETTPAEIWRRDLDVLETAIEKYENDLRQAERKLVAATRVAQRNQRGNKKSRGKAKADYQEYDSDANGELINPPGPRTAHIPKSRARKGVKSEKTSIMGDEKKPVTKNSTVAKSRAKRARPAPKKATPSSFLIEDDDEDLDDVIMSSTSLEEKSQNNDRSMDEIDLTDDDDVIEMSLSQRLARNLALGPKKSAGNTKKRPPKATKKNVKTKKSQVKPKMIEDSNEESDASMDILLPVRKKATSKPAPKSAFIVELDEESDAPKKPTQSKGTKRSRSKVKATDDELCPTPSAQRKVKRTKTLKKKDPFDFVADNDENVAPASSRAPRRTARTRKATKIVIDSDSDEQPSDASEYNADSESDFEP